MRKQDKIDEFANLLSSKNAIRTVITFKLIRLNKDTKSNKLKVGDLCEYIVGKSKNSYNPYYDTNHMYDEFYIEADFSRTVKRKLSYFNKTNVCILVKHLKHVSTHKEYFNFKTNQWEKLEKGKCKNV